MAIQSDQEKKAKVVSSKELEAGGTLASAQVKQEEQEKEPSWDWTKAVCQFDDIIRGKRAELAGMENTLSYLIAGHYTDERKEQLKKLGVKGA